MTNQPSTSAVQPNVAPESLREKYTKEYENVAREVTLQYFQSTYEHHVYM